VPDVIDLRPGDPESVAGYRLLSRLGAGRQGVVFLAATSSGELVAIKCLRLGPEETLARVQFAKEVTAARLVAPFCTAQVIEAHVDGDSPFVVSEFIAGTSLQQEVERGGPILGTVLQRMAIGTVTALAAIHQAGVVHRDFKPANVMISPEGPRVIDFGITRDLATEMTEASKVFGTPAYMSPEQLRAETAGPATDMFAWASVITYAATGRAPFDAGHVAAVMYRIKSGEPDLSRVPNDLLGVLRQCLEKDPARRPSAQQVLAQLLGRPGPAPDQADPSLVLAEATELVRSGDSGEPLKPVWGSPSAEQPVPPSDQEEAPLLQRPRRERSQPASFPPRQLGTAVFLAIVLSGAAVFGATFSGFPWNRDTGALTKAQIAAAESSRAVADAKIRASAEADVAAAHAGLNTPSAAGTGTGGSGGQAAGGTIPESFAGTWKGQIAIMGDPGDGIAAEVTLKAGLPSGQVKFPELDCSGTLNLTLALVTSLTMEQVISQDPQDQCAKQSRVYLTFGGFIDAGDLRFTIIDDGKPNRTGSGLLTK